MLRGTTTFKCRKCGNKFKAPDFELMATVWTQPQPCPECGGQGLPDGLFGYYNPIYRHIVRDMK